MRAKQNRRGGVVLELAFSLLLFLTLTLGMLDLGVGVFRSHILSQASRQAARRAAVHGERATALGSWGPATIDVVATASGVPIVGGVNDGIQGMLVGCDLSRTRIQVEWLDGDNKVDQQVKVTVTSPYKPALVSFLVPPRKHSRQHQQ